MVGSLLSCGSLPHMRDNLTERATDAWFRELQNGRIEIMCKTPNFRLRVTAPENEAWEAVEMFERWTGLSVACDRRPRRMPRQIEGQLSMMDVGPVIDAVEGSEDNGHGR